MFEINTMVLRCRMRLARLVAPAGAEVHDPNETSCPHDQVVLEAALDGDLRPDDRERYMIDMGYEVADVADAGWIERHPDDPSKGYQLSPAGEQELARLWGSGRVPPWAGGHYCCHEHGGYELAPGDLTGCPDCSTTRAIQWVTSTPITLRP